MDIEQLRQDWSLYGSAKPRLGLWIRDHLSAVGTDYPGSMWKRWHQFLNETRLPIKRNNYQAFNSYVWALRNVGCLVLDHTVPWQEWTDDKGKRHLITLKYYRIKTYDSLYWLNPYRDRTESYLKSSTRTPAERERYYLNSKEARLQRKMLKYGLSREDALLQRGRPRAPGIPPRTADG